MPAREEATDVAADLYVYTAGGTGLEATIPSWAQEDEDKAPLLNGWVIQRFARDSKGNRFGIAGMVEHYRSLRRLAERGPRQRAKP